MKDELIKNFGEVSGLPRTESVPRAVSEWQNTPRILATENAGPPSNLPESVSAAEILAQNEQRDPMPWGAAREDE